MTDERDPKVSAAYRGLGAEEPPRALDEAILAAARHEAGARPALLAARAGRQRWYAPLAAAAVLVLAVAVTLNMQTERPGIESAVPQVSAPPPPPADRGVAKAREKENTDVAKIETADPAPAGRSTIAQRKAAAPTAAAETRSARNKDDAPAATPAAPPAASEPKPFMAQKPAPASGMRADDARDTVSSASGILAQPGEERRLREAQAAPAEALAKRSAPAERAELGSAAAPAAAPARVQQKLADTPERELERIAGLRVQGKHEEADKALADFRKRNPDYDIPEAMRARIERR